MRALVIYCHPNPKSFTAAVRDTVVAGLERGGAEVRLVDLYGERFEASLSATELTDYEDEAVNCAPVQAHVDALRWCDTLGIHMGLHGGADHRLVLVIG